MMGKVKKVTSNHLFLPLFALALLLVFNAFATPGFFAIEFQNGQFYGRIIDILNRASILVILSMGMTFVIATGGIDISQGSVIAISGAICCSLIGGAGDGTANMPLLPACLIAVLVCALCGVWNGFLVAKLKVQPIVATMILLTAGRGIAQLISDGKIVTITSDAYYFISGGYLLGLPIPFFIAMFVVALVLLLTKRTAFGLAVESIGVNADSSRLAGIKVERNLWLIYILCGTLAALSGLIESAGIKGADCNNCGLMIEMDGILAVAIGGTSLSGGRFSIISSVLGALVVQTITTTILAFGIAPELTRVFKAIIVVVICLAQSQAFAEKMRGLFHKKGAVIRG